MTRKRKTKSDLDSSDEDQFSDAPSSNRKAEKDKKDKGNRKKPPKSSQNNDGNGEKSSPPRAESVAEYKAKFAKRIKKCRDLLLEALNLKGSIREGLNKNLDEMEEIATNMSNSLKDEVTKQAKKLAESLVAKKASKPQNQSQNQNSKTDVNKPNQKIPLSFSQIVKAPVGLNNFPPLQQQLSQRQTIYQPQQQQQPKPNNHTIILKPKKSGDNPVKLLQEKVNPYEMGVQYVRPTTNGAVIVACKSQEQIDSIAKKLQGQLDPVAKRTKKLPQLAVHRLPDGAVKEDVDKAILNATGEAAHFVRIMKYKYNDPSSGLFAICTVTPRTWQLLVRKFGKIFLERGWSMCPVKNSVQPVKCLKCHSYGHVAKHCKLEHEMDNKTKAKSKTKQNNLDNNSPKTKQVVNVVQINLGGSEDYQRRTIEHMMKNQTDVAAIQEPYLQNGSLKAKGYNSLVSGKAALLIRNTLKYNQIYTEGGSMVAIEMDGHIYVSVYCSPNTKINRKITELSKLVKKMQGKQLVIMGDFNVYSSFMQYYKNNIPSERDTLFDELVADNTLCVMNKEETTFHRPGVESILDYTVVSDNCIAQIHDWKVHFSSIRDHKMITFTVGHQVQEGETNHIYDYELIEETLKVTPLPMLQERSKAGIDDWIEEVESLAEAVKSEAKIPVKESQLPYWTEKLEKMKRIKNNLLKAASKAQKNTMEYDLIYETFRNIEKKYKYETIKAKRKAWENFVTQKESWGKPYDAVKNLLQDNSNSIPLLQNSQAKNQQDNIQFLLNSMFPQDGVPLLEEDVEDEIDTGAQLAEILEQPNQTCVEPITRKELKDIVNELKPGKAPGLDKIDNRMSGLSTDHALLDMITEIEKGWEKGEYVAAVSFDVSAAFDSIPHNIIIESLAKLGVNGDLIRIVADYLVDREISYTYNNNKYSTTATKGSQNTQYLKEVMNKAIKQLIGKLEALGLKLNEAKTQLTVFTRKNVPNIEILVNNQVVRPSNEMKYLGIVFDNQLNFVAHYAAMHSKAMKAINIINRLFGRTFGYGYEARRIMSMGLINSLFYYGAAAHHTGLTLKKNQDLLVKVQRLYCLKIISAYSTVSGAAASVLAGLPPLDLAIKKTAIKRTLDIEVRPHAALTNLYGVVSLIYKHPTDNNKNVYNYHGDVLTKKQLSAKLDEVITEIWQRRWDEETTGRVTHKWIPNIQKRLESNLIINFYTTQALTEHGFFSSYLKRFFVIKEKRCLCGREQTFIHLGEKCKNNQVTRIRRNYDIEIYNTEEENMKQISQFTAELFRLREELRWKEGVSVAEPETEIEEQEESVEEVAEEQEEQRNLRPEWLNNTINEVTVTPKPARRLRFRKEDLQSSTSSFQSSESSPEILNQTFHEYRGPWSIGTPVQNPAPTINPPINPTETNETRINVTTSQNTYNPTPIGFKYVNPLVSFINSSDANRKYLIPSGPVPNYQLFPATPTNQQPIPENDSQKSRSNEPTLSQCASSTLRALRLTKKKEQQQSTAVDQGNADSRELTPQQPTTKPIQHTPNVGNLTLTEDGIQSTYEDAAWASEYDRDTNPESNGAMTTAVLISAERHDASRPVVRENPAEAGGSRELVAGKIYMPQGPHENTEKLEDIFHRITTVQKTYDHARKPTKTDNPISPQSILGKYFDDIDHQNDASRIVDRALEQLLVSGQLGHPFSLLFYHHKFIEPMQYLVLRAVKERFFRPAGPAAVATLLPYKEYMEAAPSTPAEVKILLDRKEKELNEKLQRGSWGELVTTSNGVFTLEEIEEDLLVCFPEYALAHCVSADFEMSAGVAKQITRKFGSKDDLKGRGASVWEIVEIKKTGKLSGKKVENYVLYMVTKERYNHKPTERDFLITLKNLVVKCKELNIGKLAIPRLGCGRDKLNWDLVRHSIIEFFKKSHITVRVCTQSRR
ncbi:unnamed protein product [Allacma fusca]|uniref:Macro domain-containing protein n=1 Tax=Allacma fusca TaxID=39272 RepID=A0A8J2L351_9HEXA|nr:unnamed protein product [Allacma fusca]